MFASLPPATRVLIVINIVVFLLQHLAWEPFLQLFALWPIGPLFRPWQLVTYAFLHGSMAHIFFNMFALFMFGRALEEYWGSRRFMTYYMASVLAAGATQLAVQHGTGTTYETIGASGGIFGILLAFAMFFPRQRIILLFPPIPLPAWLFVTLYGALELILGVTGTQEGVAHFAHLGGMLGGAVVLLYWRASGTLRG
jgi:membrane associated rhomboid family serine protease